MPDAIDCSSMSHPACVEPEATGSAESAPSSDTAAPARAKQEPLFASYECVNACASSLGVVALVNGAVAGLGCLALPPACPAFLVAAPLTLLEACDAGCRELASK
jgi:hypothetical protein